MARNVVDLDGIKVQRIARRIAPTLGSRGNVILPADSGESADLRRRAGRRAGRMLGERVRTGVTQDGRVWVSSLDHEYSEGEIQLAVRRFSELIGLPRVMPLPRRPRRRSPRRTPTR